jgi:hypothetical protein
MVTEEAKDVRVLTSSERGESGSITACCNAEREFIPQGILKKGVRHKVALGDGLPTSSEVFTKPKCSICVDLSFKRHKKTLYLKNMSQLNTSYFGWPFSISELYMLELAETNDIKFHPNRFRSLGAIICRGTDRQTDETSKQRSSIKVSIIQHLSLS